MDTTIEAKGDQSLSSASPIKPLITLHKPSFDIEQAELSAIQNLKPQITFGVHLNVVNLDTSIGIGAVIGMENTFQFGSGLKGSEGQECQDGIKYDFNLKAELEAFVNLPTQSLSTIPAGFNFLTPKTAVPLLEMKPLNLLHHCFQTPSFCKSRQADQTNKTCSARISSDEL